MSRRCVLQALDFIRASCTWFNPLQPSCGLAFIRPHPGPHIDERNLPYTCLTGTTHLGPLPASEKTRVQPASAAAR